MIYCQKKIKIINYKIKKMIFYKMKKHKQKKAKT